MAFRSFLVTGGAGFIGSNFIRYVLGHEPDVGIVNLDALTYAGSLENLKELRGGRRYKFVQGDICDRKLVDGLLKRHEIDAVVHFAAETHVDRSITGPAEFIRTNVMGTLCLLEAALEVWSGRKGGSLGRGGGDASNRYRFHHISTDEVFGTLGPEEEAWTEGSRYAPNSPYAASKAASDHLVRAFGHTHGLPFTITNCSNNYGPFQFPEKLVPLMISNALEGKELPIYGDGGQVRDWIFVEDHCEAIWEVLSRGRPGHTYNVGSGAQPTNMEVVLELCGLLDELVPGSACTPHAGLIKHVPDRPGHDRRYALDMTKIRTELGWQPRHRLKDGLRKTVEWYLANRRWLAAIRAGTGFQEWMDRNYAQREEAYAAAERAGKQSGTRARARKRGSAGDDLRRGKAGKRRGGSP